MFLIIFLSIAYHVAIMICYDFRRSGFYLAENAFWGSRNLLTCIDAHALRCKALVSGCNKFIGSLCKFTSFPFTSVSCHWIWRVSAMRTYWRIFRKTAIFSSKLFCLTYFISIEKYPQLTYESNFSPRRLANPGEVSMDSNSLLEIGNLMQS